MRNPRLSCGYSLLRFCDNLFTESANVSARKIFQSESRALPPTGLMPHARVKSNTRRAAKTTPFVVRTRKTRDEYLCSFATSTEIMRTMRLLADRKPHPLVEGSNLVPRYIKFH